MTLRERLQNDGVGMRWLRTAATTFVAVVGALTIMWSGLVFLIEPRFQEWTKAVVEDATVDLAAGQRDNKDHLDRLTEVVVSLEHTTKVLSDVAARDSSPSWQWSAPDTSISDGGVGGNVTIRAGGYKLRECGIPRVDLYFVNGDGVYHRFKDPSILTTGGRGVAFPVDPNRLQKISYTATIPADENVHPGRANGFISLSYPDRCPSLPAVVVGPLQFRITS